MAYFFFKILGKNFICSLWGFFCMLDNIINIKQVLKMCVIVDMVNTIIDHFIISVHTKRHPKVDLVFIHHQGISSVQYTPSSPYFNCPSSGGYNTPSTISTAHYDSATSQQELIKPHQPITIRLQSFTQLCNSAKSTISSSPRISNNPLTHHQGFTMLCPPLHFYNRGF